MIVKKIIRVSSLIILTLTLTKASFGQKYSPGFIVQHSGDTLKGLLYYPDDFRKVNFKKTSSDEHTVYTPTAIRGFGIRESIYESGIDVRFESSSGNETLLSETSEVQFETASKFMLVLARGLKSLYMSENSMEKRQFFVKTDTAFELLIYKRYLRDVDGKTVIAENSRYVGQLSNTLGDCGVIHAAIKGVKYNDRSLQNLFNQYYNCQNSGGTYVKPIHKIPIETGVFAGAAFNDLKFSSDQPPHELARVSYQSSTNFTAGVSFGLLFPKKRGRWSVFNELQYISYSAEGESNTYVSAENYKYVTYKFDFSYIRLNTMLRFSQPLSPRSSLFINVGVTNGYALQGSSNRTTVSRFYSLETNSSTPNIIASRKYEQGILAGLGYKLNRFSLQGRYQVTNGFSDIVQLKSTLKQYAVLVGFRF